MKPFRFLNYSGAVGPGDWEAGWSPNGDWLVVREQGWREVGPGRLEVPRRTVVLFTRLPGAGGGGE